MLQVGSWTSEEEALAPPTIVLAGQAKPRLRGAVHRVLSRGKDATRTLSPPKRPHYSLPANEKEDVAERVRAGCHVMHTDLRIV